MKYPKDTPEKKKERRSAQIFRAALDTDYWEENGYDHNDHGVDYIYELIDDESVYTGNRILCQIKGETKTDRKDGFLNFDFPVNTASYACRCTTPFFFILVDLSSSDAFYLLLQEYFIDNPERYEKLRVNKSSVRVKVPLTNRVDDNNFRKGATERFMLDENGCIKMIM